MSGLELLNQETILKQTKPHPLAFYDLYAIWIYLVVLSFLFILYLNNFFNYMFITIPLLEGANLILRKDPTLYYLFWLILILIPSIQLRPLFLYGGYLLGLYLASSTLLKTIANPPIPLPIPQEVSSILINKTIESSSIPLPALQEVPTTLINKTIESSSIPLPPLQEVSSTLINKTITLPILQGVMLQFEAGQRLYLITWLLLIIIPGIIIALTRISWRWFVLFLAIGLTILLLRYLYYLDAFQINIILITIGLLGIVGTEIWRRRHRYYITNLRIVTEAFGKRREVFYDKISELIMEMPLLGRIFRFGSIIPLTSSGIGTGMDISLVGVGMSKNIEGGSIFGMGGGGKTILIPRARSAHILFGIPDPKREYLRITELMQEMDEVENLKKVCSKMEEVLRNVKLAL